MLAQYMRRDLPGYFRLNQAIHAAIVAAIADDDPNRAQRALRSHLSQSLAFSDELRVRFPDYFKE